MGRNKYDMSGECFTRGKNAEDLFCALAKSKKFQCTPSSSYKNIYCHVDFILERDDQKFLVDVKGRKKTNRFDKNVDDLWIWIELQNVNGKKGWIYGSADWIAFERINDFVLINRNKLINLIESFKMPKELVSKASLAKYRLYQRKASGRKDLITQIEMSRILEIDGVKIWKKI